MCYAPWSNLEILPSGSILPCCKFRDHEFNIMDCSIDDYWNSEQLQQIKQDFLDNKWPRGCERCRVEENSQIPSKRQLDYVRWQTHYEKYDINSAKLLTISLALGNTCNLKCIMCNPHASSFWAKEYKDVYDITVPSLTDFKPQTISRLLELSDDVIHIDIHGGEPFLAKQADHEALLDFFIDRGRAARVSIHYTTNGTTWPHHNLLEKWQHFREIDLQISIDGIEKRYEYIRFPASWHWLEQQVQRYLRHQSLENNFKISIAHTVTAFNIFYLDEFYHWCESRGLPEPWAGALHRPGYLRPSVWPEPARLCIAEMLHSSNNHNVKKWAHHLESEDSSEFFNDFCAYVQRHDNYRGTCFESTFKELHDLI